MRGQGLQGLERGFVVHSAAHVRAVLGLGCALVSARGAAGYLGHHGFMALLRAGGWVGVEPAMLDCGTAPGFAWAALMDGVPLVVLGKCPAREDMIRAWPGRLRLAAPETRDLAEWEPRRGREWLETWATGA